MTQTLDRVVLKEEPFPEFMDPRYLEQLLETLPEIRPDDPENPEWPPTPMRELDLTPYGYNAIVHIKDESANPTGTIKDRRSLERGPVFYRIFADNLFRQHLNGTLAKVRIPRFTDISAGNVALSQAIRNEKSGLPPPKVLLDISTPKEILRELMRHSMDIYLAPLDVNIFTGVKGQSYTPKQVNILTNNIYGHNADSSKIINAHHDYYDWHVHEVFNFFKEKGGYIFLPYGSGELFNNYITWQNETARNGIVNKDIRLKVNPEIVSSLSIMAAEPERIMTSKADKLTGLKPFTYYKDNDIRGMRSFMFSGEHTGVYRTIEEKIIEAYHILTDAGFKAEPSAAAGLALYLQMLERKQIDPKKPAVIINTGHGLYKKAS